MTTRQTFSVCLFNNSGLQGPDFWNQKEVNYSLFPATPSHHTKLFPALQLIRGKKSGMTSDTRPFNKHCQQVVSY